VSRKAANSVLVFVPNINMLPGDDLSEYEQFCNEFNRRAGEDNDPEAPDDTTEESHVDAECSDRAKLNKMDDEETDSRTEERMGEKKLYKI
jgi:hypothetical protein